MYHIKRVLGALWGGIITRTLKCSFPSEPANFRNQKLTLKVFSLCRPLLIVSIVHVCRERFPCMNFVERSSALNKSRRCREVEYGYQNGDPYTIRTTDTIYISRSVIDLLCMSMSHNTFLTKFQSLGFHSFLCFLGILNAHTLVALELPGRQLLRKHLVH
jgi:hypothetical protein